MDYRDMVVRIGGGAVKMERNGVVYVTKPIPDLDGVNRLDPRLFESAKGGVGISYPRDNRNITGEELAVMRREIGAPNRRVTAGETTEEKFQVKTGDAEATVYRYEPVEEELPREADSSRKVQVETEEAEAAVHRYEPAEEDLLREMDLSRKVQVETEEAEAAVHRYEPAKGGRLPVLIYIHGGGFIGGEAAMCENLCRDIAVTAPAAVFSVEYRLAPEYRYPLGLQDCFAAVDYILDHLEEWGLDKERVSIAGDSAGGNLALCCSMREAKAHRRRIHRQFLLYPAVNIGKYEPESYCWREDYYGWSKDPQERAVQEALARDVGIFDGLMTEAYAGGMEKTRDEYVCPILNRDWSGMPETFFVLAEYDYLSQEGEYLAGEMAKAGNDVTVYRYLGMCHAFGEQLGSFPQAEDLMREIAGRL